MRDFLDRWTPTHTNTNVPGFTNGGTENKDFFSTRFVENGSFIKMKSITLGYTLPELACKALGISNLRVYASIQTRSTLPAILDWILKLPWVVHWYKV